MIICTLAEIGVEGAEIQDHQPLTEEDKAQMFVDIMPEDVYKRQVQIYAPV